MDLQGFAIAPRAETSGRRRVDLFDSQALVAQLGGEVAGVLSAALERVNALTASGRIDNAGLLALREEIDRARRAGIMGQQVVRLGTGHVQQARERLDLSALLREALRLRGREIERRGIEIRQRVGAAAVISDATLLFSLLETLLDWSFAHAVSCIDLELAVSGWPAQARLTVAFDHRPPDEVDTGHGPLHHFNDEPRVNTMAWRLLQQTASVLDLHLQRHDGSARSELVLSFPTTLTPRPAGPADLSVDDSPDGARNSQPLAGRHVVVLSARRELRNTVREALRPMGLMIDFVASLNDAQALFDGGLPHAVVFEAVLGGERFERLRAQMLAEVPGLAFIQIAEHGEAFEVLNHGGRQFVSVGRDAIVESLPAALLFELTRHG